MVFLYILSVQIYPKILPVKTTETQTHPISYEWYPRGGGLGDKIFQRIEIYGDRESCSRFLEKTDCGEGF